MLELAQECKKLEIFTHVSTCYVNCTIPGGPVEEKVYNVENNAEKIVKRIMAMNPQEVADNEKDLIGKFPNTYTFTKSLAEQSLYQKRGGLNVVLLRPSIIASGIREPVPGWTDSISAAGGISLLVGLGLINYINAVGYNHFDVVPVDIVCNSIIITTAHSGIKRPE